MTYSGGWFTLSMQPSTLPSAASAGDGLMIGMRVDDKEIAIGAQNPNDTTNDNDDWIWWEYLPYTQINTADSSGTLTYPIVRQVRSRRKINHVGETLWFVCGLFNGVDDIATDVTAKFSSMLRL